MIPRLVYDTRWRRTMRTPANVLTVVLLTVCTSLHCFNGYLGHKGQFMWTTGAFDLTVKVVKVYPVESWSPLQGLLFLIVMRHCRACSKVTRSVAETVFSTDATSRNKSNPMHVQDEQNIREPNGWTSSDGNLRWNATKGKAYIFLLSVPVIKAYIFLLLVPNEKFIFFCF